MDKDHKEEILYAAKDPYPPVLVNSQNLEYARLMQENMAGQNSEFTAVNSYNYNNLIINEEEIAMAFHKISIVEMHHFQKFGQLTVLLGENPRLWTVRRGNRTYWSPSYIHYPQDLKDLLETALREELETIRIYQEQADYIQDEHIVKLLQRIIQDEEIHVHIFESFIEKYCIQ